MEISLEKYKHKVKEKEFIRYTGKVSKIVGLMVESTGPIVEMGEVCIIYPMKKGPTIKAEVVGFNEEKVILMPLGEMKGVGPGSRVVATGKSLEVEVGNELLGRIIDGLGNIMDNKSHLFLSEKYMANNSPPNPLQRERITEPLPLGIKAIDSLLTCGKGQRIGIFAGSGVGKSTLLGMIAKNSNADINVIALVGERGREVREFIENELGEEGLKKSVVVVATSDQPALVRVKAPLIATAIAEFFRDQGKNVVLMMDSVTRFSMAQREIGLAVGEPPVSRGYPPSVFAQLPKLLERAGTSDVGSITGLYTVLVDGDDFNEPISDAVRGILDGHIMLSRKLAARGQYPAIDISHSVSRVMVNVTDKQHQKSAQIFREVMATYDENEDLITIGAYAQGTNPKIDHAIDVHDAYIDFLKQQVDEPVNYEDTCNHLNNLTV